ncbi:MAG: hypothetical protein IPL71_23970 [Anaerolineales bacterium]|uniref:hypothetical protein n=1 Tax=Candidatus Villigracilis proximus TaxID=3140683 RepID=UPI003135DC22|nr:hypothetical protein [Anaerolineales bacterium]
MHGEEEHAEGEHAHEREIITIKLNAQPDGSFAGYLSCLTLKLKKAMLSPLPRETSPLVT